MSKSDSPIETLDVRVQFFGPYRIMEWVKQESRKNHGRFQRFRTYLNWHKGQQGKPYIRGTLVRSVAIRQLEEMFALFHSQFENFCSGQPFRGDEFSSPSEFIRRRTRYIFGKRETCDHNKPEDACLFCQILGVCDHPGKNHKRKNVERSVQFTNFSTNKAFAGIKNLAWSRAKNRYDRNSQKARDYFKVWEADYNACPEFFGAIKIDKNRVKDSEDVKCLLAAGLAGIRYLAGAPCRMDIVRNIDGEWDSSEHRELLDRFKENFLPPVQTASAEEQPPDPAVPSPPPEPDKPKALKSSEATANTIIEIVKKTNKETHLRRLADAVRELRRKSIEALDNLPEIRKETGNPGLWGLRLHAASESIREVVKKKTDGLSEREYILFLEKLGESLYQEAKKEKIVEIPPVRVLGENEYYSKPSREDPGDQPVRAETLPSKMCEWFITGYLKATSPFFFGIGPGNGQIDLRVLTDANGRLRLSFDILRGVLRRDLRTVLSGCNMEIGTFKPCECPVCELMSRCKFQDAIALGCELPPEIRQRIKIDPHTGTVEKGALFNMEVGPEGLRFPFILRFRSNEGEIDLPLRKIIGSWVEGNCLLGGNVGTGKGTFHLIEPKFFKISLASRGTNEQARRNFHCLLQNRHFMGLEKRKLEQALEAAGYEGENDMAVLPSPGKTDYTKVTYSLYFKGPVLSNDPIAAVFDRKMPDAVMFKKPRVIYDEAGEFDKIKEIYCLKGEGIRGPLRYLVGKREDLHDLPHDDCQCLMCRVFGSNQIGGNVRFGDLELDKAAEPIRCDHVAIDWNGGGREHAKYDDYPLSGSPRNELKFIGAFWVSNALDEDSKRVIKEAFAALQDGMATIGANGAIGYGWVSRIEFDDPPEWLKDFPAPVEEILGESPSQDDSGEDKAIELSEGCKYNPYYYLQPDPRVTRSDDLITHEHYHDGRLSGKITCDLKTLSPLFIPDTNDDRALDVSIPEDTVLIATFTTAGYGMFLEKYPEAREKLESIKQVQKDKDLIKLPLAAIKPVDIPSIGEDAYSEIVKHTAHKSHRFFRVNDEVMLSGSELRGMVATIYQMLTNSCFRNMNEAQYLSRRVKPKKGEKIEAGILMRGDDEELYIQKVDSFRLPLYDDYSVTKAIDPKGFLHLIKLSDRRQKEKKLKKVVKNNNIIAEWAEKNRVGYLLAKNKEERESILRGLQTVKFTPLGKEDKWDNGADKVVKLDDNGDLEGYVKFTGLNNANKVLKYDPKGKNYVPYSENWDTWNMDSLLSSSSPIPVQPTNSNHKFPRPVLYCLVNNAEYTITKRCERIFQAPSPFQFSQQELRKKLEEKSVFQVSKIAQKHYEAVVDAYEVNVDHIPDNFRTQIVSKKLTHGDLVYFQPNGTKAENIVPVCISRKTDARPLGRRFLPGYEALRPCDGECLEDCETTYPNCLSEHVSRLPFHLCPTCSLFGTTNYRGRLRFGPARLIDPDDAQKEAEAKWYDSEDAPIEGANGKSITIKLLERPRATWPLPNSDSRIPGRKIYVNHPEDVTIEAAKPTENNSTIEPLAAGNRFRFQISFDNLSETELGTLIYAIELESGMAHRLGRGKPLGLGSVRIEVKDILITNSNGIWDSGYDKREYIEKGKVRLTKWFGAKQWDDIRHVCDLQKLLRIPTGKHGLICYPELEAHTALKKKWAETAEFQARLITPWEPWNADNLSDAAKEKKKDLKDINAERSGTVKWFNKKKGFGVIVDDADEKDVFVHHTGIQMTGYKTLSEGQCVSYEIVKGKKRPKAEKVKVVD